MQFDGFKAIAMTTSALLALVSCSGEKKVSFSDLEAQRAQARENALFNAQLYRAENPRFDEKFKIVSHGDSTQSETCPQGDGWATLSVMSVVDKHIEKYSIKCSTVSVALGCFTDSDFVKKPFAKAENRCDESLPRSLPKIAK